MSLVNIFERFKRLLTSLKAFKRLKCLKVSQPQDCQSSSVTIAYIQFVSLFGNLKMRYFHIKHKEEVRMIARCLRCSKRQTLSARFKDNFPC